MTQLSAFVFLPIILALILAGCGTNPTKPKSILTPHIKVKKPQTQILQQQINQAKNNQDWATFIQKSQQLWQQTDAQNQMAIEYQILHTLKKLPKTTLLKLTSQAQTHHNIDLQDWLALAEVMQRPSIWQPQQLKDLQTFNDTAIYQQHLLPQLINHPAIKPTPQNLGILLPLTGKYATIGLQIRNGILKHYYQTQTTPHPTSPLTLRFYDTSNPNQVWDTYQQAIKDGAQKIIGPLQKQAITLLAKHHAHDIIALNQINQPNFEQFSYKPTQEAQQIVKQLQASHYHHIGILTNDLPSNLQLAHKIHQAWSNLSGQKNHSSLKQYPTKRPKLRQALGDIINETNSQARKNNLQWLIGIKPHFTPRTRQDLDALVIISDEQAIAVFKPQLKFFDLKLPIIASASITPRQFQFIQPNRDLSNIIFPTSNALLNPGTLNTAFEAYGWDSLTLAIHPDWINENLCFNAGKQGRLTRNGHQIETHLVWAYFNKHGIIKPYPPMPNNTPTKATPPKNQNVF